MTALALLLLAAPPGPPPPSPVTVGATVGRVLDAVRAGPGWAVSPAGPDPATPFASAGPTMPSWDVLAALAGPGRRVRFADAGRAVEFVPAPPGVPAPPSSTDGPFRVAVQQVVGRLDADAGRAVTEVTLAVNWEPRLAVVHLDADPAVTAAATAAGPLPLPAPAAARVGPRGSQFVATVRLAGVPRSAGRLTRLAGSLGVVGADRRLTFTAVVGPPPVPQTQAGVTVTLGVPTRVGSRVDVAVDLSYPAGPVAFESFEQFGFLADNALTLTDPAGKPFTPAGDEFAATAGGVRAVYHFTGVPGPGGFGGWAVAVTTPAPLAEYRVRFDLADILLP